MRVFSHTALLAGAGLSLLLIGRTPSHSETVKQPPATNPAIARVLKDIRWETSLAAAKARAQREGKPILLLHMMGKLNEEFC